VQRQLSLLEQQRLSHPNVSDDEHVVRWAADVVHELGLEPPVDPELIASYLGVSDVESCDLDVAGCLWCGRDRVVIKVRRADHPRRRRFTVCHECSHTFFPGFARQTQFRCNPGSERARDPKLERLCDVGASELLLPRRQFSADIKEAGFSLDSVELFGGRYEASLEATAQRAVALNGRPSLFIALEVMNKTRETDPFAPPKLRVARSRSNSGALPFVPRYKSVSEGTPLHRALTGDLVNEVGPLPELLGDERPMEIHARRYDYGADGHIERVVAVVQEPRRSTAR